MNLPSSLFRGLDQVRLLKRDSAIDCAIRPSKPVGLSLGLSLFNGKKVRLEVVKVCSKKERERREDSCLVQARNLSVQHAGGNGRRER